MEQFKMYVMHEHISNSKLTILSWKKISQAIYKFNNLKGLIVEFLIVLGKDKLV